MGLFKYSAGHRGNTVTVLQRKEGGVIYARVWDASARDGKGNFIMRSLGHRDENAARRYADAEAGKMAAGDTAIREGRVKLKYVMSMYLKHRSPEKKPAQQATDMVRAAMWLRVLGDIQPAKITREKWNAFIAARFSGAIDLHGKPVPESERKRVRARSVEYDAMWLRAVFNWASKWQLPDGTYLMRENPIRGYPVPTEKNPQRPTITAGRYKALRAKSDAHKMEIRWDGKRHEQRSYISELIDLAYYTGRRISSILQLRYSDLHLERTKQRPHGGIVWPAETDKMGFQSPKPVPLAQHARTALNRVLRDRPGIGDAYLFPSPKTASKPIARGVADGWLRDVERMAKLDSLPGGAWHPFRRNWATARKHLPDADVAATGGWRCTRTLAIYQQPDDATMYDVVSLEVAR